MERSSIALAAFAKLTCKHVTAALARGNKSSNIFPIIDYEMQRLLFIIDNTRYYYGGYKSQFLNSLMHAISDMDSIAKLRFIIAGVI